MTPDSPTEEALFGDLDVSREGEGPPGRYRIVFRPVGQSLAPSPGREVEGSEALKAVLQGLELTDEQIASLWSGLENSPASWVRVLAPTAVLKKNSLI